MIQDPASPKEDLHPRVRMSTGSAYTLTARTLALVLGFGGSILTARALGTDGKGLLALALQVPSLATIAFGMGLNSANTYFVGRRVRSAAEAVSDSFAMAALISIPGSVLAFTLMRYGIAGLRDVAPGTLAVSAFILPWLLWTIYSQGVLTALGQMRRMAVNQIAYSALSLAMLALLYLTHQLTVLTAVLTSLTTSVLLVVLHLHGISRCIRGSLFVRPSLVRLREEVSYAGRAYIAGLASYLDKRQDLLILGMLGTVSDVGIYSVGVVFAELLWQIPSAIAPTLTARSLATDETSGAQLAAATARATLVLLVGGVAALSLIVLPVIRLAYGASFVPASSVLWIMAPGIILYGVALVLWNYLMANGTLFPRLAIALAVLNLGANVALIPVLGFRGAALASLISYSMGGVFIIGTFAHKTDVPLREVLCPKAADVRLIARTIAGIPRRALNKGNAR